MPSPTPSAPTTAVVVFVDLGPETERILARAATLPLAGNAHVEIVHVVPDDLPVAERRRAEADADRALAALVDDFRRLRPGVQASATRLGDAIAPALSARAESADLVVMGRGRERPLRDAFLGSVAERIVRDTHRPVLVVRQPVRGPWQRPALALDLDDAAPAALAALLRLLPTPPPACLALHACPPPYQGMAGGTRSDDERIAWQDQEEAAARDLRAFLEVQLARQPQRPTIDVRVKCGAARRVIVELTRAVDADLLVTGTRARGSVATLLLGSVAGDVLREVSCDVLAVPPA